MTMLLAPSKVASEDDGAKDNDAGPEKRRQPQQKPAGSAEPAEINPNQI
jgi:hypothetical protein